MLLVSSNNGLDPYDYHLCKNVLDCFKKLLGCNQIHSSWPGEKRGSMEESVENEQDVEEHVEQDVNIHELEYNDGSNEVVKVFNQNVLYTLNGIAIINFESVVNSVFVRKVIKIKVILIYQYVLFVEHNKWL